MQVHFFLASGAVLLVYYFISEIGHRHIEKFILHSEIDELWCAIDQLSLLLLKFRQFLCSVRYRVWIECNDATEADYAAERPTKPLVKLKYGTKCCYTALREPANNYFGDVPIQNLCLRLYDV